MIGAVLMLANEVVEVRVHDNAVYFRNSNYGGQWAPIEGLKLNYEGVIKEMPELQGNPSWEVEAIVAFKEKIRAMKTEDEKIDYIIDDLRKHGYTPKLKQKQGFRPERLS